MKVEEEEIIDGLILPGEMKTIIAEIENFTEKLEKENKDLLDSLNALCIREQKSLSQEEMHLENISNESLTLPPPITTTSGTNISKLEVPNTQEVVSLKIAETDSNEKGESKQEVKEVEITELTEYLNIQEDDLVLKVTETDGNAASEFFAENLVQEELNDIKQIEILKESIEINNIMPKTSETLLEI